MKKLDRQIADAFALLGVLLVFVIAYASALLPHADELIAQPRPDIADDRRRLRTRLNSYRRLTGGLIVLVTLVFALLLPLTEKVLRGWVFSPFPTTEAGLLLVDVLLVLVASVGAWLIRRLTHRIGELAG